jgi:DNA polymerase-1
MSSAGGMPPPPDRGASRLGLFDGHGIIYRAYFGGKDNPLSVRKTGEVTTAVFGFMNTLLRVISDLKPTHIAVTMDRSAPTFRHERDATYKAHRAPMPDDLRPQIARVRELVETFNIPIYDSDRYEADDCLGTLSRQAAEQGIETYLVTMDSDIVQLVRDHVKVYMYRPYQRDVVIFDDADAVKERYGVLPEQIPDLKGLKGDTSDNIPGVPGVGEKTALKLITTFQKIENIYEFLWQVSPPKLQESLRSHEAQARHSKEMATIVTDCPVTLDIESCRVGDYDRERVMHLFQELEFRSLMNRLPEVEASLRPAADPALEQALAEEVCDYRTITDLDALDEYIARIRAAGRVALDTETTSQSAMAAALVGISLSVKPYEAVYIPVGHSRQLDDPEQLPLDVVIEHLRPVLADPEIEKTGHNIKYDVIVLANHGLMVEGINFDTMVAAYLLGESTLGLKSLAFDRLGIEMTNITELIGTGKKQIPMSEVAINACSQYACADADMTGRLRGIFEGELREKELWDLFADIEMPLVPVLVRMERHGVAIDTAVLRQMSVELATEMKRVEEALYEAAGETININSPTQLSKLLFEKLDLPKTRKTASGWSTDAQAMDFLKGTHPVVDLLFEYRQLTKLKSTYVDALPGMINPKTGRIHTNYNQTRAATGRLSSEDPNLQNIPNRTELGRQVRRAFIPTGDGDGPMRLVSADYSQIELRILAHITQEPFLLDAFGRDEDIHRATATVLFNVPSSEVTYEQRQLAKTINFAVLYGLSAQGLSQRTDMSRADSAEFIRTYFERYPGVKRYLDDTVAYTRRDGYATTLLGRRRYIPDINSANFNLRQAAERMADNHPIQGTNADIIKIAMNRIEDELELRGLRGRMLLQVHDELVFECPEDESEQICRLALEIMPEAMTLDVPLKVEIKRGRNWGDMEPLAQGVGSTA